MKFLKIKFYSPKSTMILLSPQTFFECQNKIKFIYKTTSRNWSLPAKANIYAPHNVGYAFFRGKYLGAFKIEVLK